MSDTDQAADSTAYMHRRPGHLIRRAHQIHDYLWLTNVSRDVTPTQFSVLSVVAGTPGVDQVAVSRETSLDTSTAGAVVERLVNRGWIIVGRDPQDRRRKLLSLTAEGERLFSTLLTSAESMTDLFVGSLDAREREQLIDSLIRVVDDGEGIRIS